jgi:hypothetical protein
MGERDCETARGPNANALKELLYPFEAEETGLRLLFQLRFFNGDPEAEALTSTLAKLAPPLTTSCLRSSSYLNTVRSLRTSVLVRRLLLRAVHTETDNKPALLFYRLLRRRLVTPRHRQEFLNAVVQIWQDAIAIGELANRAIGPVSHPD